MKKSINQKRRENIEKWTEEDFIFYYDFLKDYFEENPNHLIEEEE